MLKICVKESRERRKGFNRERERENQSKEEEKKINQTGVIFYKNNLWGDLRQEAIRYQERERDRVRWKRVKKMYSYQ